MLWTTDQFNEILTSLEKLFSKNGIYVVCFNVLLEFNNTVLSITLDCVLQNKHDDNIDRSNVRILF